MSEILFLTRIVNSKQRKCRLQLQDQITDNYCYWPSYIRDSFKINKMALEHSPLDSTRCARCPVNIKFSSGNHQKTLEKMKLLENQSSVTDGEEFLNVNEKRVPTKSKLYDEFECSSDSNDELPPVPICKPRRILANMKPVPMPSYSQHSLSTKPVEVAQSSSNGASTLESRICNCKNFEAMLLNVASGIEGLKDDMKYLMLTVQQNAEVILPKAVQPSKTKLELDLNKSLEEADKFNAMVAALQTIGGKDVVDTTRRILSRIITNDLAVTYNWTGRNDKENFGSLKNINNLIFVSVRKNNLSRNATQREVEDVTKTFLRNAGVRCLIDGLSFCREKLTFPNKIEIIQQQPKMRSLSK